MNVSVLIPAYNPDGELINYIKKLQQENFDSIIVVDDGCRSDLKWIFDEIEAMGHVVLHHAVNMGKGRALKDGINYFLNNSEDSLGLITADSDGQHLVENVKEVAQKLISLSDENVIVLGSRDFNLPQVPPKSRFGNKLTSRLFSLLYGMKINDTQTGLRGLTKKALVDAVTLSGDRFEYETQVLINCKMTGTKIVEVPIETVYIDNNSETHFDPIIDSIKIYKVVLGEFLSFSMSSILSFIIDISVFQLLLYFLGGYEIENQVIIATFGARAISSLFNYFTNCKIVFKNTQNVSKTIIKYYILAVIQALCSGLLVQFVISKITILPSVVKVIVDTLLYFISFRIQKGWVFRKK